ncbi:Hypothetical predicted protein [Marmota monax]|uniref:Uncharacterized protein n=1 Tax=Marmota monax TaxID=9995 RepID=A0A5E4DC61_MARMO|nr:Hypothetical predicted protein [Marmota monax]
MPGSWRLEPRAPGISPPEGLGSALSRLAAPPLQIKALDGHGASSPSLLETIRDTSRRVGHTGLTPGCPLHSARCLGQQIEDPGDPPGGHISVRPCLGQAPLPCHRPESLHPLPPCKPSQQQRVLRTLLTAAITVQDVGARCPPVIAAPVACHAALPLTFPSPVHHPDPSRLLPYSRCMRSPICRCTGLSRCMRV